MTHLLQDAERLINPALSSVLTSEQLVVYRRRCPFKIYIPSEQGKHCLKVRVCCGVDTIQANYIYKLYASKQGQTPEVDQATRV